MKKIRTDFVTNSSSSSFIIAKKLMCSIDEIKDSLYKNINYVKEVLYLFENDDEIEDELVEKFICETANKLFVIAEKGVELDPWTVSKNDFANDRDAFEYFVYEYGKKITTENFKIG